MHDNEGNISDIRVYTIIDTILNIKFSKVESKMDEALYKYFKLLDKIIDHVNNIEYDGVTLGNPEKNIYYLEKIFVKIYYAIKTKVCKEYLLKELLLMLLKLMENEDIRDIFVKEKMYVDYVYLREISDKYYDYMDNKYNYEEIMLYMIENTNSPYIILSRNYNKYLLYKFMQHDKKNILRLRKIIPFIFIEYDTSIFYNNIAEEMIKEGIIEVIMQDIEDNNEFYGNVCLDVEDRNKAVISKLEDKCEYCKNDIISKKIEIKHKIINASESFNNKKDIKPLEKVFKEIFKDKEYNNTNNLLILFLRYSEYICRKTLGEFLASTKNKIHLKQYIDTFNFKDIDILSGLRSILNTFILAGESQQIIRILLAFSEKYYNDNFTNDNNNISHPNPNNKSPIKESMYDSTFNNEEKDSIYILSFSILVLNTNLHNISNKIKMTKKEFIDNNKQCKISSSISDNYLSMVYDSIKEKEFKFNKNIEMDIEHYKTYKTIYNYFHSNNNKTKYA
ncbi:GDP/GTP exchange factor, partial [Spraguea lophii 42_110]